MDRVCWLHHYFKDKAIYQCHKVARKLKRTVWLS